MLKNDGKKVFHYVIINIVFFGKEVSMNKIGIYAYCGFQVTAEERFKAIKDAGFDTVSVWCNNDFNTNSGITEYEQFKFIKENGLNVSYGHAPTKFTPYLANKFYGVKEAIKTHKIWAKGAGEQKLPIMVIHVPTITSTVIDNLGEIAEFSSNQGVKLAVENLTGDAPFDKLFKEVKDIYFCYDTCHALMFGDNDGKMAEKYAERLVCTHLSDGDGAADCHWMLKDGKYDFDTLAKRLKDINYKGDYTLEVFGSPRYTTLSEFLTVAKQRAEEVFNK